jgi:hypothetical protein
MSKAWFENGKFCIKSRYGKLVWMGRYWISWGDFNSESGQIHRRYYDRRFLSWYNRKGRYIESRWREKRAGIMQHELPKLPPEGREENKSPIKQAGRVLNTFYAVMIAIIKFIIVLAVLGIILYVIYYYVVTSGILNKLGSGSTPIQPINHSRLIQPVNYSVLIQTINQSWAYQFFAKISQQRGSEYVYCPTLSQFAQIRFNAQISHYEISHYGVQQDDEEYGIYDAEEVLFPSGSPSGYAYQLEADDPLHWQLLMSNSYTYYGYYIGNGPDIESYCNPAPEIPGPGINISQYLESKGCTPVTTNATYLIVELDNTCPSTLT